MPAAFDDRVVEVEAAVAVLLDEVEENDGVGDHDAREHQDSNQSGQRERGVGGDERDDRAGRREWNRHQQHQRLEQRAEGRDHDQVDEADGSEQRESELSEHRRQLGEDTASRDRST